MTFKPLLEIQSLCWCHPWFRMWLLLLVDKHLSVCYWSDDLLVRVPGWWHLPVRWGARGAPWLSWVPAAPSLSAMQGNGVGLSFCVRGFASLGQIACKWSAFILISSRTEGGLLALQLVNSFSQLHQHQWVWSTFPAAKKGALLHICCFKNWDSSSSWSSAESCQERSLC